MITKFSKSIKTIVMLFLIVLAVAGLFLQSTFVQRNNAPTNTGAIFGGRIEQNFISAGYIIATLETGGAKLCGFTHIQPGVLLTAAHCLDSVSKVVIKVDPSQPEITIPSNQITFIKKSDWNGSDISKDVAIITFDPSVTENLTLASIAEPKVSCDYRVVGFGRTLEDGSTVSNEEREKRSTAVCITSITDDLIYLQGVSGGICLGDSGSPLYLDRENEDILVGIISSIVIENSSSSEPCFVNNKAVAVRTDANLDFITEFAPFANIDPSLIVPTIQNGGQLDVTEVINSLDQGETFQVVNNTQQITISGQTSAIGSAITLLGIPLIIWQGIYVVVVMIFLYFSYKVLFHMPKPISSTQNLQNTNVESQNTTYDLSGTIDYYEPPPINS